jgi:hypothetical protein
MAISFPGGGAASSPAAIEAVAAADAAAQVATEAAARASALTAAVTGLVNSAPGAMDTLGEIAALLSSDESVAGALATTVAGKLAIASNLSDLANASTARTNLGVNFSQGTIGSRPSAATFGVGWYLSDENGDTLYHSDGSAWTQVAAGVSWPSGQMVAGPAQLANSFDVKAVGTTVTDVTGMTIAVPASASRPVLLKALFQTILNGGTSTAGSLLTVQLYITDNSNNPLAEGAITITSLASSKSIAGQIPMELYLPSPVSAATYKVRAACAAAVPTNWSGASLIPGHGVSGSVSNFYALTV